MKKQFRFIALVLLVAMLAVLPVSAFSNNQKNYNQLRDVRDKEFWAYDNIKKVATLGIMNGMSPTAFEPNGTLTRAQFMKIMQNLAGGVGRDTTYTKTTDYADVPVQQWYYDCIQWGTQVGIANGMEPTRFAPDNQVTREQLATLMYRFITVYCGMDLSKVNANITYLDAASVSDYAKQAVGVMSTIELLKGKDGNIFDPTASATRAEAATIAGRLLDYYNQNPECFTGVSLTKMWGDEFDGTELDMDTWEYGQCGDMRVFGLNSADEVLQYQKDHIKVQDGKLVMNVEYADNSLMKKDSADFIGTENTSVVWVNQKERFDQPYGYYEVRCKLNQGSGVNSAFWMAAGDPWSGESKSSQDGTEIDVFETMKTGSYAGRYTEMLQSTVHWQHSVPDQKGNVNNYMVNENGYVRDNAAGDYIPVDFFDDEFHTFGVLWTKDEYIFFYDGYEAFRTDCSKSKGVTNVPAYILLSCHFMNPDWYGVSDSADFPTDFSVDYVRWYQLTDYLEK